MVPITMGYLCWNRSEMKKEKYIVEGMSCAACSARVEKAVNKLNGVKDVQVNLLTGTMQIHRNDDKISSVEIEDAVKAAGYDAKLESKGNKATSIRNRAQSPNVEKDFWNNNKKEADVKRKQFLWSLLFLLPLMYFSMGHMIGHMMGLHTHTIGTIPLANTLSQLILLIPILYLNRGYFIKGIPTLLKGTPNMDSLISMGAAVSVAYGIYAMYEMIYGHETKGIYFESAAMILTLITMGRFLEARSKSKTTEAIEKLVNLRPKTVIIEEKGEEISIPIDDLEKGNIIIVRPGQVIPADGEIVYGESWIEESAVTGESVPVAKSVGDKVISATLNQNGILKIKAERVGEDSTINQIISIVNEASGTKASISKLADKIAGIFVPTVIAISLTTFIGWSVFTGDISMAINCAISVLVISCPCSLGLATPVAIMVGTGKGAEEGILIRNGEALERLQSVDTILMDKTGTITVGKPQLTNIKTFDIDEKEVLRLAAALEWASEHPLGAAIVNYYQNKNPKDEISRAKDFKAYFGKGVSGIIDGKRYLVGNKIFMQEMGVSMDESCGDIVKEYASEGKTAMLFADNNSLLGIIAVADIPKEDSYFAIEKFKESGVEIIMLTGDNELTGKAIATDLGIDNVIADVMPQDKEAKVRKLMELGKTVAMIGDGINDGPALARADVGIAIGAGTDVAIESADVVLINNRLTDAYSAYKLSSKVMTNIKENLFWAFFYNIILIPIAAGVFYPVWGIALNPMMGAAAMSLSSFCVVMNSLRLKFFKGYKTLAPSPQRDNVYQANNLESKKELEKMNYELNVRGMMCKHCEANVAKALSEIEGVEVIESNLETGKIKVESDREITTEEFKKIIEGAGYELV